MHIAGKRMRSDKVSFTEKAKTSECDERTGINPLTGKFIWDFFRLGNLIFKIHSLCNQIFLNSSCVEQQNGGKSVA